MTLASPSQTPCYIGLHFNQAQLAMRQALTRNASQRIAEMREARQLSTPRSNACGTLLSARLSLCVPFRQMEMLPHLRMPQRLSLGPALGVEIDA